jgi:HEAT repeat protein
MAHRGAAALALIVTAAAVVVVCGAGEAGSSAQAEAAIADLPADTLASALLATVRGADPVVCELAVRAVDGRHGWSSTADELAGVGTPLTPIQRATIQWAVRDDETQSADAAAVAPLAAALGDPDPCVRRMAALKLGRGGQPGGIDALRTALRAASVEQRSVGALGLGYAEDPAAIDALGDALDDASPEVRAAAAWALGEIEDASAIPLLVPVLREDDDPGVRRVAAWALGAIE